MDSTALSLCNENSLPIVVFDMNVPGNIAAIVRGEPTGTLVRDLPDGAEHLGRTEIDKRLAQRVEGAKRYGG